MNSSSARPEDYLRDYSPVHEAELVLCVVDERPKAGIRRIARQMRSLLLNRGAGKRDVNDTEADHAWRTMQEEWGNASPETIAQFLAEKFAYDYLRKFEYAFWARCLARPDVTKSVIVDMGGGNSYSTVVPILFRIPDAQILSIDVVNRPGLSKYGVRYVRGDCIHTHLPDESADIVALISTLEHVGLGRWGDPADVDGDIRAMREAWRIVQFGGHVVLAIPYGYPTVVYNLHRVYDAGRLAKLLEGFDCIQAEYSLLGQPATRLEVEGMKMVASVPGFSVPKQSGKVIPQIPGGAMLLLRKVPPILR